MLGIPVLSIKVKSSEQELHGTGRKGRIVRGYGVHQPTTTLWEKSVNHVAKFYSVLFDKVEVSFSSNIQLKLNSPQDFVLDIL